jgi:hypothetical protein
MVMNAMRTQRNMIATALVAVAIAGCSGSSSKTGPLDPATFTDRYCALFAPCCTDAGVTQGAACRRVVGNTASLVGRTGELGEACLAELKAKFDGYGYCNFAYSSTPSCDRVLGQVGSIASGTIPPGGDCSGGITACAPSARGYITCTFDFDTTPAVPRCQESIPGALGDGPCILTLLPEGVGAFNGAFQASGFSCATADGLYCDSASDTCVPLHQPGEPCSDVDILACATNFCADNICTARGALGGSCVAGACVDGAFCGAAGTCEPMKAFGAACTSANSCVLNNCTAGICAPPWSASALGYLCEP